MDFFVDLDMRQHQRRVDSERAEHLSCLDVVEAIETTFERLGLLIMEDRARRLGSTLKIESEVGEGTRVMLAFALPNGAQKSIRATG